MDKRGIFQAMFEEATIGMLVVNASGKIVKANLFVAEMFGYESGALDGKQLEILLPESLRSVHTNHRKHFNNKPAQRLMGANLDLYGLHKNGNQFPVEISLSHMDSEEGQLAIAYIHDVSVEKQKAMELQKKSKVIASGVMPIAFTDLEGNLTEVNDAFVKMSGYEKAEDLIGLNNSELSSTFEEVTVINKAIREHGSWSGEATARRKDGSLLDIYITSSLITDESGRPISMLASFIDISDLKIAQSLNQDIFKIVEDSLNEIFIFDVETLKFIHVNKGARTNMGYTLEEMQQMTPFDIKPNHTESSFTQLIAPLLSGEKEKIEFESIHQRKDKTTYPIEAHLQYSMMGEEPVFVAIILDITESKKAKEKLQNINIELEEKVRERTSALKENENKLKQALGREKELGELKSRFVSMASHEFRTPLSSILSSSGLIGRYPEADQQEQRLKHVSRIKSSVNNLTRILNDFLSLEKLESGNITCEMVAVNFREFVASFLDEIKLLSEENQTIKHYHSGKDIANIDEHLVKNILINLLSNAIKYSPDGEKVEIISVIENGTLNINVRDYGLGIPLQDQQHMFTRFFRAANVTNIQGTGLGLTIVKRYLNLMNGRIDFESKENEGTTFMVEIPQ